MGLLAALMRACLGVESVVDVLVLLAGDAARHVTGTLITV